MIPGVEISDPVEDFRGALKVEQYRVGKEAVYFPAGFRWEYLPLSAVKSAEESYRSVSGGHCVTVTERKPAVDFTTEYARFTLNLERIESVRKVLDTIEK